MFHKFFLICQFTTWCTNSGAKFVYELTLICYVLTRYQKILRSDVGWDMGDCT
jgi:hypothetical protein